MFVRKIFTIGTRKILGLQFTLKKRKTRNALLRSVKTLQKIHLVEDAKGCERTEKFIGIQKALVRSSLYVHDKLEVSKTKDELEKLRKRTKNSLFKGSEKVRKMG